MWSLTKDSISLQIMLDTLDTVYVDNELAAVVALMKQVVARQQHVPRCSLRLRLLGEIFTIFSNILSMSSREQVWRYVDYLFGGEALSVIAVDWSLNSGLRTSISPFCARTHTHTQVHLAWLTSSLYVIDVDGKIYTFFYYLLSSDVLPDLLSRITVVSLVYLHY